MAHTYSNPRLEAVITDWPIGSTRTTATFRVETTKRGQRATRFTIDPKTGRPSATKALTYARKCRIVDGDDGRTYLVNLTEFGHLSVFQGNMQYSEEAIFPSDPRFADVAALFVGEG